jgi:hypothetical protein
MLCRKMIGSAFVSSGEAQQFALRIREVRETLAVRVRRGVKHCARKQALRA